MNTTLPWSIRDVSFDAREAAVTAARHAGLSVGDWLDAVIAEQTASGATGASNLAGRKEAISQHLSRTATLMSQPVVRHEVERYFAATGTDGVPLIHETASTRTGDSFRNSTALQSIADRLTRFEQQSWTPVAQDDRMMPPNPSSTAGDEPGSLSAGLKRSRPASVRDAVAAIARRQAALDAETNPGPDSLPSIDIGAGAEVAGATPADETLRPAQDDRSTTSIGALGQAVSALEARLAGSRGRGSVATGERRDHSPSAPATEDTSAAFQALSRDLRQTMASIDSRSVAVQSAEAPVPATAASSGDQLLGDIRSLLDRFRPGATLDSLDRRVQDLSERLDQRFDSPTSLNLIESLSRRVEEMHASLKISATGTDMRQIEMLMRGVANRIEDARDASTDMQTLEGMVRQLTAKVEATRLPFDAQAVSGLELQLARLGERLERSEASLTSLDAVERSLSELFTQVEQTRHATIDAAETAARTAARDTLRAAMQHTAVGRPPESASQAVEKVGQDVADLRLQHEAAERRTQATLTDLHQTMEKLLGHLETLDVAGRRISDLPGTPTVARSAEADMAPRPRGRAPAAVQADKPSGEPLRAEPEPRPAAGNADPIDSLIEPRSGRGRAKIPDVDFEPRMPPAETAASQADGPANFIAAARRAAQAAQASAAEAHLPRKGRLKGLGISASKSSTLRALDQAKAYLAARRRPVLLSLAGLVLLIGALEIVKVGLSPSASGDTGVASSAPPETKVTKSADATPSKTGMSPLDAASRPAAEAPPVVADRTLGPDKGASAPIVSANPADGPPSATQQAVPVRSANPFLAGLTSGADSLPAGLKTQANAGDAAAQYEMGLRFAEGRTVARDPKAAVAWFQKAAAQGLAPAQYRLGSAYEKGIGEARDPALAMTLYGRAAEAGNIRAMHNLAVMAAEGSVGKPDYAKAASWFGKASAFGVRDSEFNLAILYARGLGIEQNLGKSYIWFAVAANQGDDDAAKKRDEVAARLDPKALDAAKAEVEAFRPAAPVAAANEVTPPPGGWDAASPAKPGPGGQKAAPAKSVIM